MKYCTKCGCEMEDDAVVCPKCGNVAKVAQATAIAKPVKSSGIGIAALVFSIIGFMTGFIIIGIFFDIVAFILAIIALLVSTKKHTSKGLPIASIIIAVSSILFLCVLESGIFANLFFSKKAEIGETIKFHNIEYTVNNIEVTPIIEGDETSDDFLLTKKEIAKRASMDKSFTPINDNDIFISVSFSVKNIGKSDYTMNTKGIIDYNNGYTYKTDYLFAKLGAYKWQEIDNGCILEKLTSDTEEFRTIFSVPMEVISDTESPLEYEIFNRTYTVNRDIDFEALNNSLNE